MTPAVPGRKALPHARSRTRRTLPPGPPRVSLHPGVPRASRRTSPLAERARKDFELIREWSRNTEEGSGLSPRDLHSVHRAIRRLRIALAVLRRATPKPRREPLILMETRLRTLSRLVGSVRDLDVSTQMALGGAGTTGRSGSTTGLSPVLARLRDDAQIGRELLRVYLARERERGLLREISRISGGLGRTRKSLGEAFHKEHRRGHRRLKQAYRRAVREPTVRTLHGVRVALRRARHFHETAGSSRARGTPLLPAGLGPLQVELGRLHDLDNLITHVERRQDGEGALPWLTELKELRRSLQNSLFRFLTSPNVSRALRKARAWPHSAGPTTTARVTGRATRGGLRPNREG
jgi:CHAD domain-containing protein